MGVRSAILRWLTNGAEPGSVAEEPPPPPAASFEVTTPPEPVGGSLVVGSADRRIAPLDLPEFYDTPVGTAKGSPVIPDSPFRAAPRDYDPAKVREAWALVGEQVDRLVGEFYAELFLRLDEALTMFPSSMSRQRQEFGRALVQWVVTDDADAMTTHLDQLGADHRKFDVEPRHYEIAGIALLSAWRRLAGPAWTYAHEQAVIGSYTRLASVMIDGAIRHIHDPASWGAQVVDHQRVLRDFAVVRVQPDAPYPFKAGQYLTLETPSLPRQWRQMSIASAPRADNTFDLHVRAVGASGVSAALVMHTHPGDRLRLGPPRGNDLVVEPGTVPGGLLCVASGTGAAPITAVVESALAWPEPPSQLYAYVGGRTTDDIYPVDKLHQLIAADGSWQRAHVYGVVSDDPGYRGLRGRIEAVVPSLKDWAGMGVDVLIAGPDPMIATTVTNLAQHGVPLDKIHFDQYELAE